MIAPGESRGSGRSRRAVTSKVSVFIQFFDGSFSIYAYEACILYLVTCFIDIFNRDKFYEFGNN